MEILVDENVYIVGVEVGIVIDYDQPKAGFGHALMVPWIEEVAVQRHPNTPRLARKRQRLAQVFLVRMAR
jgi:hypothetical protein